MEVHHHPDLHHKRKNFKEYFLEFLMLFLAVILGFFAENIREHFGDKKKERQYMVSMVEDLKADRADLHVRIPFWTNVTNSIGTTEGIIQLKHPENKKA